MALTPQNAFRQRLYEERWEKRKWSQAELAERVTDLGLPMGQRAISAIESGNRDVNLDEAFVIAAALNIPPPLLWLSLGSETRIEITTKSRIHPHLALKWFRGDQPLASTDRIQIRREEWLEAAAPLQMFLELEVIQQRAHAAQSWIRSADYAKDREGGAAARSGFADALRTLYEHNDKMAVAGIKPVKVPNEWRTVAKQLGLERKER